MHRCLLPTLWCLVLIGGGSESGWSASADERDQQALAIAKLIEANLRLPAERQLQAFRAVGYPADSQLDQILRYLALERFHDSALAPDSPTAEAERSRLRADLEHARAAGQLSGIATQLFIGGGGRVARMVNDIARIMHPDGAPPLAPLPDDQVRILARKIDVLGQQVDEEFTRAIAQVKSNQAADDHPWQFPDGSKEQLAALSVAVGPRVEALRQLNLGMSVLRDAAYRGAQFGLDRAPVQAQIRRIFTSQRADLERKTWADVISQWDFEWGEFNPWLRLAAGTLLGDALGTGAATVNEDDVRGMLQQIADFSTREYRDPALRSEVYRLKLLGWTELLHLGLVRGDERSLVRGWSQWQDFQKRAKADDALCLGKDPRLAAELGRLSLVAARIAQAKGDVLASTALLLAVMSARPVNPCAAYAKAWLAYGKSGDSAAGGRSGVGTMEPEHALLVARALCHQADTSVDAGAARQNRLQAAVVLRNGLLGLRSGLTDEQGYVEFAPQTYHLYTQVLHQLGMYHQAVVAALDGAQMLASKIAWYAGQKRANPWKKAAADGTLTWDESRTTPMRIANDALLIANQLRLRDPNMQAFYRRSMDLMRILEPDTGTPNLLRQQIFGMLEDGDLAGALRESDQMLRAHPEQYLWVVRLRNMAVPMLVGRLLQNHQEQQTKAAIAQLVVGNVAALARLDRDLAKTDLSETELRDLRTTRAAIATAEINLLMLTHRYEEAINRLIASATVQSDDEKVAARQLNTLAEAMLTWHSEREEQLAKDASALVAAAQRYDEICHAFQRGLDQTHSPRVEGVFRAARKRLALVLYRTASLLGKITESVDADVHTVRQMLNRDFVELFEPTIDDQTSAANVLFIARTWWELDEHQRAAVHIARFIALTRKDPLVGAFSSDPKAFLARYTPTITARGELRKSWEEIVGNGHHGPPDQAGDGAGPRRDHGQILTDLGKLRAQMTDLKPIIAPDQYRQIDSGVSEVTAVITAQVNLTWAMRRLATFYRDNGQPDLALPLFRDLYAADPDTSESRMDLVLAICSQTTSTPAELSQARAIAARVRDERAGTTDKLGYWEAYTLVLELSVLLNDSRTVNDTLSFLRRNRSDPSRDLVAPAVWGDDRRIRRPLNRSSVQLAKRFLTLYEKTGVNEIPPYAVAEIRGEPGKSEVFADANSPMFITQSVITPSGEQVVAIIAADGSTRTPPTPTSTKP